LAEQFDRSPAECLTLVILWSAREPQRTGEVAFLKEEIPVWIFGRDPRTALLERERAASLRSGSFELQSDLLRAPFEDTDDVDVDAEAVSSLRSGASLPSQVSFLRPLPPLREGAEVVFGRQRPEGLESDPAPHAPILGESISRLQLTLTHRDEGLFVQNIGRCPLMVNGRTMQAAHIGVGDTLYLRNQLLLLCARRPLSLPRLRAYPLERVQPFGFPDADGMIGESPALWYLRERMAACARSDQNVLIVGDSGSGKELAAQAIHRLSSRRERPLVADNISAIPPSLAAALLFGNKRNFPNPGMEERVGLVGAADGSMLFLDEIGDMPEEVQPMFLRVADRQGEYFRLGEEGRIRRSDFRLVGATNRPERIRYELKRRFQREIRVPSLNDRKEDIPMLIGHLLRSQVRQGDLNALAFWDERAQAARVHPLLIDQLVRHSYITNVSEVEFLLGHAMSESSGEVIAPIRGPLPGHGITRQTPTGILASPATPRRRSVYVLPAPTAAQRALDETGGNVARAASLLGMSRHQLNRMIRRHALQVRRPASPSESQLEPNPESDAGSDPESDPESNPESNPES
jgi:DNA-binding NtrC family response regulator